MTTASPTFDQGALATGQGRLIQSSLHASGWKGQRMPAAVMEGTIDDLLRHVARQDADEMWRFTIVTGDGHYIRGAELRERVRELKTGAR